MRLELNNILQVASKDRHDSAMKNFKEILRTDMNYHLSVILGGNNFEEEIHFKEVVL